MCHAGIADLKNKRCMSATLVKCASTEPFPWLILRHAVYSGQASTHARCQLAPKPEQSRYTARQSSTACLGFGKSENPDWQNHHFQAFKLQPALQSKRGLIVEQSTEKILLLKHQFSGEKDRLGEISGNGLAECLQLIDEVDTQGITIFRIPT